MTTAVDKPMTPRQVGAALFSVFHPDFIVPLSQRQRPIAQACYCMAKSMKAIRQAQGRLVTADSISAASASQRQQLAAEIVLPELQTVTTFAAADGHVSISLHRFLRQFDSDTAPARQGAAVGTGAAIPPPVFRVSSLRKCARRKTTSTQ